MEFKIKMKRINKSVVFDDEKSFTNQVLNAVFVFDHVFELHFSKLYSITSLR